MAPSETPRPLRVDAARNRDATLESARRVFAESGTDAALEEIARRADVGIATLYRRFPTREDLVAAAFELRLRAYEAAAKAAAAAPDPWEGFSGFVPRRVLHAGRRCGVRGCALSHVPDHPRARSAASCRHRRVERRYRAR